MTLCPKLLYIINIKLVKIGLVLKFTQQIIIENTEVKIYLDDETTVSGIQQTLN